MNMLIKRRQLIMATLVVALGAAVFVNWYFTRSGSDLAGGETTTESSYVQNIGEAKYVNAEGKTADYFSEVKLTRQKSHDEALEKLEAAIKAAPEGSDSAKSLKDSADALSALIKSESDIETLISAKIKSECVVVINGDSAQIVVRKGSLGSDSALQISDIVTSNSSIKAENIKISESE